MCLFALRFLLLPHLIWCPISECSLSALQKRINEDRQYWRRKNVGNGKLIEENGGKPYSLLTKWLQGRRKTLFLRNTRLKYKRNHVMIHKWFREIRFIFTQLKCETFTWIYFAIASWVQILLKFCNIFCCTQSRDNIVETYVSWIEILVISMYM